VVPVPEPKKVHLSVLGPRVHRDLEHFRLLRGFAFFDITSNLLGRKMPVHYVHVYRTCGARPRTRRSVLSLGAFPPS